MAQKSWVKRYMFVFFGFFFRKKVQIFLFSMQHPSLATLSQVIEDDDWVNRSKGPIQVRTTKQVEARKAKLGKERIKFIAGGETSNMCSFHPYLGKWSNLTDIFQMGWNHQPDRDGIAQEISNRNHWTDPEKNPEYLIAWLQLTKRGPFRWHVAMPRCFCKLHIFYWKFNTVLNFI